MGEKRKIAVVLFNLGGPDGPDAVKPFLFNLFFDPYIIRQPAPLRWLIAKIISSRRTPVAQEIYAQMGGKSPILEQTRKQATALETAINKEESAEYRVFIAMRYWHPLVEETIAQIVDYGADEILLLPLYPQFSTSTTESFFSVWEKAARDLDVPVKSVCCYPENDGFISAIAQKLKRTVAEHEDGNCRILFSAHGLPKKFVEDGDPYQAQVEQGVAAILDKAGLKSVDHVVCYQSRVGPVEWLKPYTDEEIERAGTDGRSVIVVPVAFVSEHSETLVELDIEYRELAASCGVPNYYRIETVQDDPIFINGLVDIVTRTSARKAVLAPDAEIPPCGGQWRSCPLKTGWNERICR